MSTRCFTLILCGLALTARLPAHAAPSTVPFGRFAQPSLTGEGTLSNLDHNVVVESGFKLQYLAHQRKSERWGAPEFAGFFSVLLNGDTPAHKTLKDRREGTQTLLAAPTLGRYAKDYVGDFGRVRVTGEDAIGRPLLRLSAEFEAKDKPLKVEWLLTGFEWVDQPAPTHWAWCAPTYCRLLSVERDGRLYLPPGDGYLLASNEGQPYTLALLLAERPDKILVGRDGVTFHFEASDVKPGARGRLPDLYAAALEAHPADALLSILPALARPAKELVTETGWSGEKPFVRFRWAHGGNALIPVPPPFSEHVKGLARQEGSLGPIVFAPGPEVELPLAIPPNLERLTQDFPPLPDQEKAAIAADVKAILAHQKDDGQFAFSSGRPFYDGQTAGVLIQLAPVVDEPLRAQIIAAVRKCLDYWWGRLMTDARTGVVVFPEPVMPSAVVDYPEISSTLLYPTAAYAQLVDRNYARQIWPKVARLAATVGRAYDITGSAYAHAGPEYVHVLTESTVGGYLCYASLYHLARLAGEGEAAKAFRARACWAFAAMDLYRWREEYGKGGILSQIFGHGLYVEPQLAWDYTMFTWFSWCPLWSLPAGDPYHVFEVLEQQRWWLYWRDSRQLAYDWSHFMAFVRFGEPAKGLAHWDEILTHEPTFDNFDTIALYRPLARAWKHLRAVTASKG